MQVELTEIGGLKTRYMTEGKGRPVFMLHGWGGDMHSWDALTESFNTKKYKIFALDMPGFGQSADPKKAWCVNDYAEFFKKFVQKMYARHRLSGGYNLVVHSFGGRVAIKLFAKKADSKLKKLVMIAPAGIKHKLSLRRRVCTKIAKVGSAILSLPGLRLFAGTVRKFMYKILHVHDYEKLSGVMRKTFINVIGEDLTATLEQVNCPTMIIWGTADTYVPIKDAYTMHEKIKNSRIKIIKGARHGIHKTEAKTIAKWTDDFLNDKHKVS